MNLIKKFLRCSRTAAFFLLCTVLTGCADRKSEFLTEEIREISTDEEETDDEEASKITEEPETVEEPVITETVPAEIYVDVCGAVAAPGVFRMEEGSRVFQAVEAAGGCLSEAAGWCVNQAEVLEDGQQIYIPTREEAEQFSLPETGADRQKNGPENAGDNRVNLNTADKERLMTLSGIGESKAQAILSYRENYGPFLSIEDIMKVQGIKESTFEKIKDEIVVG